MQFVKPDIQTTCVGAAMATAALYAEEMEAGRW
jgi:ATP-dependent protease ClpP protease subunit